MNFALLPYELYGFYVVKWKNKFLKASFLPTVAAVIVAFINGQSTAPMFINLAAILAVDPNTSRPISYFLPESIEIVCEFWPYTTSDDFRESSIFSKIDEGGVLPIDEEYLALVYMYKNGEIANIDKIRRYSKNFQWSLSDLTTSENCYYTLGIEVFVSVSDGVTTVSILRDANYLYQ